MKEKVIIREATQYNEIMLFFPEKTAQYGKIAFYVVNGESGECGIDYYHNRTIPVRESARLKGELMVRNYEISHHCSLRIVKKVSGL